MIDDGEKYTLSQPLRETIGRALEKCSTEGMRVHYATFTNLEKAIEREVTEVIPALYVAPDAYAALRKELDEEQDTVVALQKKVDEQAKLLRMAEATVEERTNEIVRLEKFLLKAETKANTAIEVIRILRG